jgi:hypothetical protein
MIILLSQHFAIAQVDDVLSYQLPEYDLIVMRNEVHQALFFDISLYNPSLEQDDNRFVEQVSFFEAILFANQLSRHEGLESCYKIDRQDIFWTKGVHCNGWRLATYFEWSTITKTPLPSPEEVDRVLWYINPQSTKENPTVTNTCTESHQLCGTRGGAWEWIWDEIRVSGDVSGDFSKVRSAVGGDFHLSGDPSVVYRFQLKEDFASPHLSFRLVRSNFR